MAYLIRFKKYQDKIAAYYIDTQEKLPLGSPVMEAENGAIVGLYFNRQQQGEAQPYILPIKEIQPFMQKWLKDGMKASVRLSQSKKFISLYRAGGDQETVQQALEQYGENIFCV
ncbi:hypothetical protein OL548_21720 [Lysinibacillus sp. MHQ-1]|nr:hypothetical protein OL548_21720 [Lysinibacillus sp. MHQ-1]